MYNADVCSMFNITKDDLKKFRDEGIVNPEKAGSRYDYSHEDVFKIKRAIVLTKAGLSCNYIKQVQDGEINLMDAFNERRPKLKEKIRSFQESIKLMDSLKASNVSLETLDVDSIYIHIQDKEACGVRFPDIMDLNFYEFELPYEREFDCPVCQEHIEIDLRDYLIGDGYYDRPMGNEYLAEFDSEDNLKCPKCGCTFHISGCLSEYPVGAVEQDDINLKCKFECEMKV